MKWEELETAVLKFSTEDQIRKGQLCSAVKVKKLPEDGVFVVMDGNLLHAPFFANKKLNLAINDAPAKWVMPVVSDRVLNGPGIFVYHRLTFQEAPSE